jgi:hypothetical protein
MIHPYVIREYLNLPEEINIDEVYEYIINQR